MRRLPQSCVRSFVTYLEPEVFLSAQLRLLIVPHLKRDVHARVREGSDGHVSTCSIASLTVLTSPMSRHLRLRMVKT